MTNILDNIKLMKMESMFPMESGDKYHQMVKCIVKVYSLMANKQDMEDQYRKPIMITKMKFLIKKESVVLLRVGSKIKAELESMKDIGQMISTMDTE